MTTTWVKKLNTLRAIQALLPIQHLLFPGGSDCEESACNTEDPGSVPGSGRSLGEGNGNPLQDPCLGNFHGQRSLVGDSPWGHKELDMTEQLTHTHNFFRDGQKRKRFLPHTVHKRYVLNMPRHFGLILPVAELYKWNYSVWIFFLVDYVECEKKKHKL